MMKKSTVDLAEVAIMIIEIYLVALILIIDVLSTTKPVIF